VIRLGPDERTYTAHSRGKSFRWISRLHAESYLVDARARDFPSPIRWGWAVCLRASHHAAAVFAVVACGLTLAASPLLVHLARRRLQDTAVATLTCACVVAARVHGDWSLAFAFALLLALKPEGGALAVPAIVWAAWTSAVVAPLAVGAFVYACVTAYIFGPRLAFRLWRAIVQPHDTDYGREHQRGMWHRLFVDLALVSPMWAGMALWYHPVGLLPAVLLIVAHACTPVRNVRTVLAVDLLMRAALYGVAPAWLICAAYLCDAWVVRRLICAGLYDTPTDELVRATLKPGPVFT